MKRLLLIYAAILSLSIPPAHAHGANPAAPPVPGAPAALSTAAPASGPAMTGFDWTGRYVGVVAGYGFGKMLEHDAKSGRRIDAYDLDGFLGGVYAGYSHAIGSVVLGTEFDLQYSGASFSFADEEVRLDYETRWIASARARLGYSLDRLLPYVTGGMAFGQVKVDRAQEGRPLNRKDTQTGYVLGAGLDYALTDNLIGRLEYQYMDFGKIDYHPFLDSKVKNRIHGIRVGIAYRY